MFRSNPPSPFDPLDLDWLDEPPEARLRLRDDDARSVLNRNDDPAMDFRWSLNPYRGCFHGCAYCYARPTHNYWDLGAGTDFERVLIVKRRAPELLRQAFERPPWTGEKILMSGNTDCYQPIERQLGLTAACLRVCRDYRNPVAIITKGALIARDVALLAELHRTAFVTVTFSIGLLDPRHARALEPWAPPPTLRLRAMETLAKAGIPVGVLVGPLIPGLSERQVPAILRAARDAGASWAGQALLRLPEPVDVIFQQALQAALPLRAAGVMARLHRMRGGLLQGRRPGQGVEWKLCQDLFALHHQRLGFGDSPQVPRPSPFRRPGGGVQQDLFSGRAQKQR